MLFGFFASPSTQSFIQSALALSIVWGCVFVWRHEPSGVSKLASLALSLFSIVILYSDLFSPVLEDIFSTYYKNMLVLPFAASVLLCTHLFEPRLSQRRSYFILALSLLLLGIFLLIFPDSLLLYILYPTFFLALAIGLLSCWISYKGYLHSHLPRTIRGRNNLFGAVVALVLWLILWTILLSFYVNPAFAIVLSFSSSLLLTYGCLTLGYFLVRLYSVLPGRHIRRKAIYSIFTGLGLGWLVLLLIAVLSNGPYLEPSIGIQVVGLLIASSMVIIQTQTLRLRRFSAYLFTRDLEHRIDMAFHTATSLMSSRDLRGILTSHLDDLRHFVSADKASLRLNHPPSSALSFIEVSIPSTALHPPSKKFNLGAPASYPVKSLGTVELYFNIEGSILDEKDILSLIINFNEKVLETLNWYYFQETYWSRDHIAELDARLASALSYRAEASPVRTEESYSINGITQQHKFYKDVKQWVRDCQVSKIPERDHPPFENMKFFFQSNHSPGIQRFIVDKIIESPIPIGIKPTEPRDANDHNWQIYAILKLAISEGCRDPIIYQRLGFDSPPNKIRKSVKMETSDDTIPDHETNLYFGCKPDKRSYSTYNRRKKQAIDKLVYYIASLEQPARFDL